MVASFIVEEKPLTVRQVAEMLSVTVDTVRRWLRTGQMRGRALGGRGGYRITPAEVRRFMEEKGREDGQ